MSGGGCPAGGSSPVNVPTILRRSRACILYLAASLRTFCSSECSDSTVIGGCCCCRCCGGSVGGVSFRSSAFWLMLALREREILLRRFLRGLVLPEEWSRAKKLAWSC